MTEEEARIAENRACQAVVREFAAKLEQGDAPAVAIKLCREIEARIELRRMIKFPAARGEHLRKS